MNGYPTTRPCDVCGGFDDTRVEPRFLYVVCRAHHSMSPVEVSDATRPASPST